VYETKYGLESGLKYGLVSGMMTTFVVGLGFVLGGGPPQRLGWLRWSTTDTRTNLRTGLVSGVVAGFMVGLVYGLGYGLVYGLTSGLVAGLGSGLVTSATWAVLLASAQLRRRDNTPARLLRFLDDARQRQILRTIGPVYQFRDTRLQDRLAASV
jgi:hypothetical protein